jgi:hypothetical protein
MLSSEPMERSQNLLYLLWLIAKWGFFFKFTRPQVTSGIDRQMIKWPEPDHPQSYGTKCTAGRNRPLSLSRKIWQHPHDCFGSDTVANFGCLPLRVTVKSLPNFRSITKMMSTTCYLDRKSSGGDGGYKWQSPCLKNCYNRDLSVQSAQILRQGWSAIFQWMSENVSTGISHWGNGMV